MQEYNEHLLNLCASAKPHLLVAVKGLYILPETLIALKDAGVTLYNYYPDTSIYNQHKALPITLPYYDCVFVTKLFLEEEAPARWGTRNCHFLPHAYDPNVHRPIEIQTEDKQRLGASIVFVARHSGYKENLLAQLMPYIPALDIKIYGNGWVEHCTDRRLRVCAQGWAPCGDDYARVLQSGKINLAIMNGPAKGASQVDEMTTRSFEIPACKAFMLHQRTREMQMYYKEGAEVACFETPRELAEKIGYFLAHPEERAEIAESGYRRCVPSYSYDKRMEHICKYYGETNRKQYATGTAG